MSGFVVCLGETLFDSTPAGIFLGGAPGNVAVHLSQLGAKVEFASRVGDDLLGREARRRLSSYGVGVSLLQSETTPPRSGGGGGAGDGPGGCETGFVLCEIAPNGDATYTFNEPAAWDVLAAEPALLSAVAAARCVVHGSLALRAPVTRSTLVSVVGAAKRRVFDVNLRPPHVDEPAIASAAAGAWLIKLNDDELPELARMLGLEAGAVGDDAAERASAAQLATATGAAAVCVTRGAKGAALWVAGGEGEGEWSQHSGFAAAVDARDTIGAGDSFLASLILSLLPDEPASPGVRHELDATDALARACAIGAFVASMPGATPKHDADAIERIRAFAP